MFDPRCGLWAYGRGLAVASAARPVSFGHGVLIDRFLVRLPHIQVFKPRKAWVNFRACSLKLRVS
jgi:hypothetical protein